jgi:hypothetical protein
MRYVQVQFPHGLRPPGEAERRYTYIVPDGMDVFFGDVVLVPTHDGEDEYEAFVVDLSRGGWPGPYDEVLTVVNDSHRVRPDHVRRDPRWFDEVSGRHRPRRSDVLRPARRGPTAPQWSIQETEDGRTYTFFGVDFTEEELERSQVEIRQTVPETQRVGSYASMMPIQTFIVGPARLEFRLPGGEWFDDPRELRRHIDRGQVVHAALQRMRLPMVAIGGAAVRAAEGMAEAQDQMQEMISRGYDDWLREEGDDSGIPF